MYEFWYNYVKPKYGEKAKSCYVDTESFIIHVKAEDIHKDIAEDVEKRSDTSNFKIDRPLPIAKNNKAIGLMKEGLGWQIIKKFIGLRPKTYSYLKDNNDEGKKAKETKNRVIKRKRTFQDYKICSKPSQITNKVKYLEKKEINVDCLKEDQRKFVEKTKLVLKTQQRFKSKRHNVFTEEINKMALISNNDERIQSIDSIETYAHGMSKDLICMKEKIKPISIIKEYKNV